MTDWTVVPDVLVIMCGLAELVVTAFVSTGPLSGLKVVRALRLGRILRLTRFWRILGPLRELHKLAMMMATCAKTLFWSFLLCFTVMTVWSMLIVETVNPLLQHLHAETGTLDECGTRCQQSMASVMDANLFLFQTVIVGDNWGEIAVPLIRAYPGSAVVFIGSFLTLVFGLLNLIVAAVVDTFAAARQNDMQNLPEEMKHQIEHDHQTLAKLFGRIDADCIGKVTLEELTSAARKDLDFQSLLRAMDIDENDLQMLFEMVDFNGSGAVEVQEFIGPLSRWAHDCKAAPRFIKYNLLQTMKIQEDLHDLCQDSFKHLTLQIDKVFGEVKSLKMRSPQAPESSNKLDECEINASTVRQLVENNSKPLGAQVLPVGLDAAMSVILERAVADLQASLQKLQVFSVDANEMIKKGAELPNDLGHTHQDLSTTLTGLKADVFWAHYMDRERDTGAKRKPQRRPRPGSSFRGDAQMEPAQKPNGEHEKPSPSVARVPSNPSTDSTESFHF
eukprot:Skav221517  [mRNA]  locus=scaffold1248:74447:75958:- [translate_table: standard]